MKYLTFILFLAVGGCASTKSGSGSGKSIIPKAEESNVISFDEKGGQTAGILGYSDKGEFLVTGGTVERYNYLISLYGKDLNPPIEQGFGVGHDGENYTMSNAAMTEFIVLVEKGR